ncbi:hypothetical protein P3T36_004439 [Kitasatospora sp. MAP12-15]|uniref:ATP-binding protein n=1 Tax=unclassified Kitasatospora TaxID=2633591 RepID=UPI0024748C09|nr:ATP-binding protein [Kitasatospora sp. MAP12-44]MDH6110865.1 hypothetical protein [Kitasatospora sp. MAP12-44]
MKQATLKVAGTAALGVAIAAVAAGSASAAAGTGGLGLGVPLQDTGSLTGATTSSLSKTPAVGGPVAQTMGTLNPSAGAQAPAADAAPAGGNRAAGLPTNALTGVAGKAQSPVTGLLGGAVPVSGGLPGLGGS